MGKSTTGEALKLAKKLVETLSQEADTAVQMPAPDDVADLEKEQVLEIAEAFNIETEGKKLSAIKSLVLTAARIVAEETDDVDADDLSALCEAVGVTVGKKTAATIAALSDYFDSVKDTEDGEETEEESEEEETEESEEEESEEEDEDEKPAKKKKKDAEEDEEEETEEEEESEDEDAEDIDDDEKASRLKAYNKVATKKLKSYDELAKKLVNGEGDPVEWGKAYVKGNDAYCCGLELDTIKKDGKKVGKCKVTGKLFRQDEDGDLIEIEDED